MNSKVPITLVHPTSGEQLDILRDGYVGAYREDFDALLVKFQLGGIERTLLDIR